MPRRDASGKGASSQTAPERSRGPTVAVVGNPNAGKTTIFNRLTGLLQKVGNYPGVTVEKKEGVLGVGGLAVRLLDLPGTYSLAAHSPDEMVSVDVLLGHQEGESRPDLVLDVVDASNLERNLYLLSQIQELGLPVVVALNMTDVAQRLGMEVDARRLSERLGVPVVPTQGHRGVGITELRHEIEAKLTQPPREPERSSIVTSFEDVVENLHREVRPVVAQALGRDLHRVEVFRALVDKGGYAEERFTSVLGNDFRARLEEARAAVNGQLPLAALEAQARYGWVREKVAGCKRQVAPRGRSWSDRLDRILAHRVFGFAIFGLMMLLVFQSIFTGAQPLMEALDGACGQLGSWVTSIIPAGTLQSLLVDGVIAGVGAVVVFLPQILILFFFIGLLEDCGYMARAAFLMDKIMSKCGLSGKSFIPMLSGFACAVPGIMAARVIENRRDRVATILVTPLMTCSARLPIYAILIATFIPNTPILGGVVGLQGVTLLGLYLLGIVVAVAMAWLFKKTILRGSTPPFVLELPPYKLPSLRMVLLRLYDRGRTFLLRAGTIILAISVIVWVLAYFPRPASVAIPFQERREAVEERLSSLGEQDTEVHAQLEEELARIDGEAEGAYLRQSCIGRMGKLIEPVFRPLGWDWKISMATLASFPAREVVISTLGTIYNLGGEADESSELLRDRLREERSPETGQPIFTIPVAMSILVFFALCCQCGATMATIKRETNSWRWAWFTFGYMTILAYLGALVAYQLGKALS